MDTVHAIYYQDEDGMWIAEVEDIPGCVSQGATLEDAKANIRKAINACLSVREDLGMPLTVSTRTSGVREYAYASGPAPERERSPAGF